MVCLAFSSIIVINILVTKYLLLAGILKFAFWLFTKNVKKDYSENKSLENHKESNFWHSEVYDYSSLFFFFLL